MIALVALLLAQWLGPDVPPVVPLAVAPPYCPTAAGGVCRSSASKFGDIVSVKDFGAVGDGVTDDTAALVAAASAVPAGGTLLFPPGVYQMTSSPGGNGITISQPDVTISGYGAKLVQNGVNSRGIFVNAVDRVTIAGLWLYNSRGGADWTDGVRTNALGIYLFQSNHSKILNNRIENWGCEGVTVYQNVNSDIRGNTFVGIGSAGGLVSGSNTNTGIRYYIGGGNKATVSGSNASTSNILVDSSAGYIVGNSLRYSGDTTVRTITAVPDATDVTVSPAFSVAPTSGTLWTGTYAGHRATDNSFSDLAHGIVGDNVWQDLTISLNRFRNIVGQHGIYLDSTINTVVSGNIVENVGQSGIKAQTTSSTSFDSFNLVIANNTISGTGQASILVNHVSGTNRFVGLSVIGNSISGSASNGIDIKSADNFLVENNTITSAVGYGMLVGTSTSNFQVRHGRICGNVTNSTAWAGLQAAVESGYFILVEGNIFVEPSTVHVGDTTKDVVMYLTSPTSGGEFLVRNNIAIAAAPTVTFNVNAHANVTKCTLLGNRLLPAIANSFGTATATEFLEFHGTAPAASVANNLTSWKTGAVLQGYIRVQVNGADQWFPYYAAPTGP